MHYNYLIKQLMSLKMLNISRKKNFVNYDCWIFTSNMVELSSQMRKTRALKQFYFP